MTNHVRNHTRLAIALENWHLGFGTCLKIVLIVAIVFSVSTLMPMVDGNSSLVAQDDGGDSGDSAKDEDEDNPKKKMNALQWLFKSLGILYIFIFLVLSFILVALFVMNILSARRDNICPSHLIDGFEANLDEKKYQEAYEMAKADESFLGNVLSAGLAKLSSGYAQAIEAMQEVGEEENMKLQHRLSYLALIGTISPMIGLFGTVHGMINSFHYIAVRRRYTRPESSGRRHLDGPADDPVGTRNCDSGDCRLQHFEESDRATFPGSRHHQ